MTAKRQHAGISTNFAAAESARTVELTESDGMDRATSVGFQINITLASANPATVTATVQHSADGGSTYAVVPSKSYSGSGSYAAEDYAVTKDITGDDDLWVDVDMRNANAVKLILSTDTADADDLVTCIACSDYARR